MFPVWFFLVSIIFRGDAIQVFCVLLANMSGTSLRVMFSGYRGDGKEMYEEEVRKLFDECFPTLSKHGFWRYEDLGVKRFEVFLGSEEQQNWDGLARSVREVCGGHGKLREGEVVVFRDEGASRFRRLIVDMSWESFYFETGNG